MAGFSIADFFAQLSIKADTKEVKKIEDSLNRINKALKMIGANSVAQAQKMDTAFSGDALLKQKLLIQGAHDRLERMGSSLVGFKERLNSINTKSQFLKIRNEITDATQKAQKFKNELKLLHNTNSLFGKENVFKKPDAFTSTKDSKNEAITPFKGGEDFFEKTVRGRRLLFGLTQEQTKQLKEFAAEQAKMGKSVADANMVLREQAAIMRKSNKDLIATKQKTTELTRAQNRLKESTRQLATSMFGAFAVFEGVKSINRIGQDFEGMRAAMLASSGDTATAATDLAFVDEQVVRLGLDLKDTTDAYAKLQFAAKDKLSREQTKELFVGFSEFATALKVAPEQQKAGLRAIQQMLNKGQVMAEELKSQLAEQVAGSIQVFANALNVSEKELFKMMERGELLAADVLPKVSKEFAKAARGGGALSEALKTVRVEQGRFTTQAQKSQDTIFKSGFGEGYGNFLNSMTEVLKDLVPTLKLVGNLFRYVFNQMRVTLQTLATPIELIGRVAELFFNLSAAGNMFTDTVIPKLISAAILLRTTFGRYFLILEAIIGALEEIAALSQKGLVGEIERQTGMDVGFIDPAKSEQLNNTGARGATLDFAKTISSFIRDLTGAERKTSWTGNNSNTPNITIQNNVSTDSYGNPQIESSIQRNILNGQAQR